MHGPHGAGTRVDKVKFDGEGAGGQAVVRVEARREFALDHGAVSPPRLRAGWAGEQVVLPDGRRQVTGLFLPGERVMPSALSHASESASLFAITSLELAYADIPANEAELEALCEEMQSQLSQCFRAIVRLGCLDAYEKTANLLLEIAERLGAEEDKAIDFPLTQELLADLLGLSQVHVNRTLQQLRRDELIELQSGRLSILQPSRLRAAGQYRSLFLPAD